MTVFWILLPLFLAVGLYLIWYSGRIRRLIASFAHARGLPYQQADDGKLTGTLNEALHFEETGLVRAFDRVRDIVDAGDSVLLFRTVELLDLSPYGMSESTHYSRVAVTFEVSAEHDVFSLVTPELTCRSRLGSGGDVPEEAVAVFRSVLRPPRCPLSVTLKRGLGLIYLEPLVTGSVRPQDLDYLIAAGRGLRAAFAREEQGGGDWQAVQSRGTES